MSDDVGVKRSRDARGATIALQGLPTMAWVDLLLELNPLLRLPLLGIFLALLAGGLLLLGAHPQAVWPILGLLIMIGGMLAVFVVLGRGAQTDLAEIDPDLDLGCLRPRGVREETIFAAIYAVGFVILIEWAIGADEADGWFTILFGTSSGQYSTASKLAGFLQLSITWCFGVLSVWFGSFCVRQYRVYRDLAGRVPVDLLRVDQCQSFSLQPARFLLIYVLFLSLCIVLTRLMSDPEQFEQITMVVLVPQGLLGVLAAWVFFGPVVRMRDRLREAKRIELDAVRRALQGDRGALEDSCLAHMADDFRAPDLLVWEQYVESIWDWPIRGSVQRMVFYVMLPPVAWVLAALMERLVDAVV